MRPTPNLKITDLTMGDSACIDGHWRMIEGVDTGGGSDRVKVYTNAGVREAHRNLSVEVSDRTWARHTTINGHAVVPLAHGYEVVCQPPGIEIACGRTQIFPDQCPFCGAELKDET